MNKIVDIINGVGGIKLSGKFGVVGKLDLNSDCWLGGVKVGESC